MYDLFTFEEICMMCIFDTSSRNALINELTAALPGFAEPGLDEIARSAIEKLGKMTDAEFGALELYPEYDDFDEYNEEREAQSDGD